MHTYIFVYIYMYILDMYIMPLYVYVIYTYMTDQGAERVTARSITARARRHVFSRSTNQLVRRNISSLHGEIFACRRC